MALLDIFCSLYKCRKCEIMVKALNIFMIEKNTCRILKYIPKPPMLGSYNLQHPIAKAGSTTSFSSENAFSKIRFSAEKLNIFINVSDSKEN